MAAKKNLDTSKLERLDFSIAEAAYMLGISTDKLRRLVKAGDISARRSTDTDKGHLRFTRRAMDEYLAEEETRRAA
jgi:excisionase family DNA binding protein